MTLPIVVFKWNPYPNQVTSIPSQIRDGQVFAPYTAWHVNNFRAQLSKHLTIPHELVCVTEDAEGIHPDVRVIPLWDKGRHLGGCYNRLYSFSRGMAELIGPRFACVDLDTVLVANCDHIFSRRGPFVYWRWQSPSDRPRFCCAFYLQDAGVLDHVWTEFTRDPQAAIKACRHLPGTDQAWCNHKIDCDRWHSVSDLDGMVDFRLAYMQGQMYRPGTPCNPRHTMLMFPGPRSPDQPELHAAFPWLSQHYHLVPRA